MLTSENHVLRVELDARLTVTNSWNYSVKRELLAHACTNSKIYLVSASDCINVNLDFKFKKVSFTFNLRQIASLRSYSNFQSFFDQRLKCFILSRESLLCGIELASGVFKVFNFDKKRMINVDKDTGQAFFSYENKLFSS